MKEHLDEKCIAVFDDTEGHTLEIWNQPRGTVLRTFTKGSFAEFVVEKKDMKSLIDKLTAIEWVEK